MYRISWNKSKRMDWERAGTIYGGEDRLIQGFGRGNVRARQHLECVSVKYQN